MYFLIFWHILQFAVIGGAIVYEGRDDYPTQLEACHFYGECNFYPYQ